MPLPLFSGLKGYFIPFKEHSLLLIITRIESAVVVSYYWLKQEVLSYMTNRNSRGLVYINLANKEVRSLKAVSLNYFKCNLSHPRL